MGAREDCCSESGVETKGKMIYDRSFLLFSQVKTRSEEATLFFNAGGGRGEFVALQLRRGLPVLRLVRKEDISRTRPFRPLSACVAAPRSQIFRREIRRKEDDAAQKGAGELKNPPPPPFACRCLRLSSCLPSRSSALHSPDPFSALAAPPQISGNFEMPSPKLSLGPFPRRSTHFTGRQTDVSAYGTVQKWSLHARNSPVRN